MSTNKKKTRTKVKKFMKANNAMLGNKVAMLGLSTMDGSNIVPKADDYKWETLSEEYTSAAKDVVQQLANCQSIMDRFKDPLSKAPNVNAELVGLIKSYEDQANDLIATAARHKDGDHWRKGKINKKDIDAEMEYLSILGKYMAIEESTARLTSQAMTSIMSTIMTNPEFQSDEIAKKALADLKELNHTLNIIHNSGNVSPDEESLAYEKLEGILNDGK